MIQKMFEKGEVFCIGNNTAAKHYPPADGLGKRYSAGYDRGNNFSHT